MRVCICMRWVLCAMRVRGYRGGSAAWGDPGKARGFSLTHIEGGEGPPGGRTTRQPPGYARSPGGGEWFVCLFRENGRAAAIGKNFIYMIEKCFLCGRASARAAPKKTRRVAPSSSSPADLLPRRRAVLPFFCTPASESARRGS